MQSYGNFSFTLHPSFIFGIVANLAVAGSEFHLHIMMPFSRRFNDRSLQLQADLRLNTEDRFILSDSNKSSPQLAAAGKLEAPSSGV